jgi:hypothetical protein
MSPIFLSLTDSGGPEDPVDRRMHDVQLLFSSDPKNIEFLFSPSFLRAEPPDVVAAFLRELFRQNGPVIFLQRVSEATKASARTVLSATFKLTFSNGTSATDARTHLSSRL